MTYKTLYMFLDAMTCALGGVLVIFFAELNQAEVSVQQMRGTLEQHQADIQLVADLKNERDDAVKKNVDLARQVKVHQGLNTHISRISKIFAEDSKRLGADLASAMEKNKQQADKLTDAHETIAQLTSVSKAMFAQKNALAEQQQADMRRMTVLEHENKRLAAEKLALGRLPQTRAQEVIGLQGDFKRLVFVIDCSISMKPKFDDAKALIAAWVKHLDFDKFNMVTFSDLPLTWHHTWYDSSSKPRDLAAEYIHGLNAGGQTGTKKALSGALRLPGVDTIIFLSDGAPTDGTSSEILSHLRSANEQGVVINVVALGDYFKAEYGTFLKQLAADHHGQFIGR